MAKPEHVKMVKQGAEAIRQWREAHPDVQFDLSDADLPGANLYRADLHRANLLRANLHGANLGAAYLPGADLSMADLHGTYLSGADLARADLSRANLSEANLSRVDLSGANLGAADLRGANLHIAELGQTLFIDTNLTATQSLETCNHVGPSTLDPRTLARSGPLPLAFLRGCGLSDWEIEAAQLYRSDLGPNDITDIAYRLAQIRIEQPLLFYSCFISHSSQDEAFAKRLEADLQAHGVRCWFAPNHMRGGMKTHEQIDQAIRIYNKLLLVLSPHSMVSNWVQYELRRARRREVREHCRVLFPIRLVDYAALQDWECFDADTGSDLAAEVRAYFIPDFTNWKDPDAYQQAFRRLLQDLRPEIQTRHGSAERDHA